MTYDSQKIYKKLTIMPLTEPCVANGGRRCAFPVKYKGSTYTTCGKNGYTKNWCPTSLKTSGEYEEWDYCSPDSCITGQFPASY